MRAFGEQERKIINQKLIDAGREAFSRMGVRKTSIADLSKAAGISKGSFYAFFDSKEELYLQIIEAEEASFRKKIMTEVIKNKPFDRQSLRAFIFEGLRIMETNPLIRRVYEQDELECVLRALPPERMARHVRADEDWMSKILTQWQEQGLIINADPRAIAGALKLIIISSLLRDTLGGDSYPEAIDLLVDLVTLGLVTHHEGA